MHIEHVAIWTQDLEPLKSFYETYFQARAGDKYVNRNSQFESYFLTFPSGGTRLEIMRMPTMPGSRNDPLARALGYSHLAFALDSREQVDTLTARLEDDGFHIVSGPRRTGDGYYESCVLDPDGNRLEITI
jgi:lactoylglutathione lyase